MEEREMEDLHDPSSHHQLRPSTAAAAAAADREEEEEEEADRTERRRTQLPCLCVFLCLFGAFFCVCR